MRTNVWLIFSLLLCVFNSCIKDEAPNSEADITGLTFQEDVLTSATIGLNPSYSETLGGYPITVNVVSGTDVTALTPVFELTPGATISPASGVTQDFSEVKSYTVTSEDGKWQRTYFIYVNEQASTSVPTSYHFENIRLISSAYHEFYDVADDGTELTWASGNSGFKLAASTAATEDYPTVQYENGYSGKCAKLQTCETGSLGAMVNMPIASGNLFIGKFDIVNALVDALKSTQFGTPFYNKPVKLTGYFKYTAGSSFYADGAYTTDRQDMFNIYAMFYDGYDYDANGNATEYYIDGNLPKNDYEDEHMVALAVIDNPHESLNWEYFEIEFDYDRYNVEVDEQRLANGEYKLGIVFASSVDGATFEGAPGSTLLIDEVELIYE